MRTIILIATILILCVFALPSHVSAQPQRTMQIIMDQSTGQNPVEQQTPGGMLQPDRSLWVVNHTGYIWDPDDHVWWIAQGKLASGQSFEYSKWVVCDWAEHLVGFHAIGDIRSDFEVSITYSLSGFTVVAQPIIVGKQAVAKICSTTPEYEHSDNLPPIENSNGGVGIPMMVTWKITNKSNRALDCSIKGEICLMGNSYQELYSSSLFPLTAYGTKWNSRPNIYYSIN